ncbi:Large envelope protein [Frankliniella fusca]|uniref:Large envelope protein n=1 Tax=Frankliniella fusca TaxID=407009 RepID=A0AAE1I3Q6_9NEOP|nr:Large envelope protein [Frankliniella fusca]
MSSKRSLSSDEDDDLFSSPFKLSQGSEIETLQSENDTMPCSNSSIISVPDSESSFDTEGQRSFCRQLSFLNEEAQSSFCQEPSNLLHNAKDPSTDVSSMSQNIELTTNMDNNSSLVGAGLNSVVDMEGSFDLINSQDSEQLYRLNSVVDMEGSFDLVNSQDSEQLYIPDDDVESRSGSSDTESDLSFDGSDFCESGPSNYGNSSSDECELTDQEYLDSEQLKNVLDPPLYKKSPIRLSESCIAILGFILRHQPNKQEVVDLLGLINLHCRKEESHMKTSLHFFNKFFSDLKAPLKYHYFCSACLEKLPFEKSICPNKGKKQHPDSPGISFFFGDGSHSATPILSRKKEENSNIEDIYDAQLYMEQIEKGFLGPSLPHNFSMTWNSDGIPVFKSNKSSLWPVYFMINELPYKLRTKKEHMLLGGLWFGAKSIANKILEPLLTTLKTVYFGFTINPPDSSTSVARGILLSGALDIPAKSKFMGMKQSGSFGCQICLHPGDKVQVLVKKKKNNAGRTKKNAGSTNEGERIESEKQRRITVYKYSEQGLRNHTETDKLGERTLGLKKPDTDILGVKYPSFLFKLMPDVIRGMFLPLVDRRLSQIKLPNFVKRNVSAVGGNEVVHWKGNQYFIFMMILSLVVLEDILPDKYLESYPDLVVAVNKLTSASILRTDLAACDKMLIRFIKDFQTLYGEKYMSIVIHLLQHLVFIVTNVGPIGAVSCFPFESMNGQLLKMVHGTRYVHSQVANCAFLFMRFHEKVNKLPPGDVKHYCEKILHPTSLRLAFQEKISNNLFSVGKYRECNLNTISVSRKTALELSEIINCQIMFFSKLKRGSDLFVSRSHTRCQNSISYVCTYKQNCTKYGIIDEFLKVCCSRNCKDMHQFSHFILKKKITHIHKFLLNDTFVVIPLENILKMLYYVNFDDKSYVCANNAYTVPD